MLSMHWAGSNVENQMHTVSLGRIFEEKVMYDRRPLDILRVYNTRVGIDVCHPFQEKEGRRDTFVLT